MTALPVHNKVRVRVTNLCAGYSDNTVLHNLTFTVDGGELVAVVGPNGAGKSTLMRVLAGLMKPQGGQVDVRSIPARTRASIALLPQRSQLDWTFPASVFDAVMMGRTARLGFLRWPGHRDRQLVEVALSQVGLEQLAEAPISALSGGQRQRLLVARAVVQQAHLILMDEPLAGLDSPAQEGFFDLLALLARKGAVVMVATHDLAQAAREFDRVMLLNGRLVAFDSPDVALSEEWLAAAYGTRWHPGLARGEEHA